MLSGSHMPEHAILWGVMLVVKKYMDFGIKCIWMPKGCADIASTESSTECPVVKESRGHDRPSNQKDLGWISQHLHWGRTQPMVKISENEQHERPNCRHNLYIGPVYGKCRHKSNMASSLAKVSPYDWVMPIKHWYSWGASVHMNRLL